jgi:putative oxidoreductase
LVVGVDQSETKHIMTSHRKIENLINWACRITAAVILLQTLFFKFTAAPESVYIFSKIGLEPWGRIGSGVVELIAALLLLVPGLGWLGAALAIGVLSGAIVSHLTVLGIVVMNDGGLLFFLALLTVACCAVVLFFQRRSIPLVGARL